MSNDTCQKCDETVLLVKLMEETLTRTQSECTRLLLENRALREEVGFWHKVAKPVVARSRGLEYREGFLE